MVESEGEQMHGQMGEGLCFIVGGSGESRIKSLCRSLLWPVRA
jgi:hypothetical protein